MIEVKHLKKTYLGKKKEKSRGLVDVSFSLPSNGFVFVLGKSGSGKSTLLNLLGKLDEKTSGTILIEGKDLDTFTESEINYYRSTYCGFIFQDYQLIDELSVKENVALALEIIDDEENKEERIKEILEKVQLTGYENRYPNELSGGQKQRVSIARALIKKPKLILCDEPTGNLDIKTSISILNLLKEISKTCLVFMVSHDEKASLRYAQRRIILEEGLVTKDEYRDSSYSNNFKIVNNVAYLPYEKDLKEEEMLILNKHLADNQISKIEQIGNGFRPFDKEIKGENSFSANKEKINKNSRNKLTKIYLKSGLASSSVNVVLFSLLTILIILIQTLLSFNSNKIFLDNVDFSNQDVLLINKVNDTANKNNGSYLRLNPNDKNTLFNNYNEEKYPIVNFCPSINTFKEEKQLEAGYVKLRETYVNSHLVYASSCLGTAIVDENYLIDRYKNENGELEILAGSLDNCKDSTSVILTDYLADCILDSRYERNLTMSVDENYESLVNSRNYIFFKNNTASPINNSRIGCIIKTNYKESYKDLFQQYDAILKEESNKSSIKELINSKEYEAYYKDIVNGQLTLAFSLNKNFLNDIKATFSSSRDYVVVHGLFACKEGIVTDSSIQYDWGCFFVDKSLKENQIKIASVKIQEYARLLGIKTNELIGQTFTLAKTDGNTLEGQKLCSEEFTIIGISDGSTYVSEEGLNLISALQMDEYSYLVPLKNESKIVINNALDNSFSINDYNSSIYTLVSKTVFLFGDIFRVLEVLLVIVLILFFATYSIKSIKSKNYQIGVFKSLGMKDKDITFIFLSKNIIFGIASLLLTSILAYPFLALANSLIIKAYAAFLEKTLSKLNIFYFHFDIFAYNYLLVILTFIIFTIIPLILTKKVTPAKIVNNKNE